MEARNGQKHENLRGLSSRGEFACVRIDGLYCSESVAGAGVLHSVMHSARSTYVA